MDTKDFSNLPPKERIKRLKELEKKKKQEILEMEELIEESHKEIQDQAKFQEKVPIPQVARGDTSDLSESGKEVVRTLRGSKKTIEIEKQDESSHETEDNLEETVQSERIAPISEGAHPAYALPQNLHPAIFDSQYIGHLSQQPAQDLYREMAVIYELVNEKGYASADEVRRAEQLAAAFDQKARDSDLGKYSFSENVAKAASLSQAIGAKIKDSYQSSDKRKNFGANWYEG